MDSHRGISVDLGKLYNQVLNYLLLKEKIYCLVFRQSALKYFCHSALNHHSMCSLHYHPLTFRIMTCPSLSALQTVCTFQSLTIIPLSD